jgi:Fe-S oxidoreductase/FAD/FMN-containing dehydrogenase
MRKLSDALQSDLTAMLDPARVRFDRRERKMYSHDVGEMPPLIKPLLGQTMPAGVVQPASEEELVALARWASAHKVPLTPRGRSTSGYGGALPVKGGLVIDFFRLDRLLAVDAEAQTVTVEPGMVWKRLDEKLAPQGLTLRLYPSSFPSSTVGGWLAQGGGGMGSFEYGWFSENVVSARVVEPDGTLKTFSGDDLALVADAEGITGIISQITLRVRPLEPERLMAAQFERAEQLAQALQALVGTGVPLWSVSFINPKMAQLKNLVPPRHLHDAPHHDPPKIPEKYVAMFVYPASRAGEVEPALREHVSQAGGTWLDDEIATHEWEDRFNLMKVKRMGPSVIPTEVIVPLHNLAAGLDEIESAIKHDLVIEGMLVGGVERPTQAILLGFIPHDGRKFGFNLAYATSLSAIKIAKKHGGRGYATGLYFAGEAERVLGREKLARLKAHKQRVDPHDLMNPGKVFLNGVGVTRRMSWMMGLAQAFEPLIRPMANLPRVEPGERLDGRAVKGIPPDVAWYARSCSQCGFCVSDCDQFYGRGWESQSPRGKFYFLKEFMAGREKYDKEAVTTTLICTTCERCNVNCSEGLPIEPSWMKLRGQLIHNDDGIEMKAQDKMTFPPFYVMAASARREGNIWGAYKKNRSDWLTEDIKAKLKDQAEVAYFAGCTSSYVENDIAQATTKLLDAAGYEFTYMGNEEECCGIPMLVAGRWDVWEEILRHNVAEMKKRGAKTVVTSCPACWLVWHKLYPEWAAKLGIDYPFESKHYAELLAESIQNGNMEFTHKVPMRVTFHDSCHIGRAGGVYEPPRDMLKAIPGVELVEMEHNRREGLCCGSVLTLIGEPPVAHEIGDHRLQEALDVEAEAMLALCPCCEFQLRVSADRMGTDMPVHDLAWFAAQGLGINDIQDATHFALTSWATFEKMVYLMSPQGFADLMADALPELMDAMPLGMGKMMGFFGKLGGGFMLDAMKPMFPVLFPLLLPGMMPKVMPRMLELMGERVPMPDYMAEQMPELMPLVMDELMPRMLPELVPAVTPLMIDYLKGQDISGRAKPYGVGKLPWELEVQ